MAPVTVTFVTDAPRSTVPLSLPDGGEEQAAPDALFAGIERDYGTQISRFATGDEQNAAKRHQLRQEMLLAVWQSLAVLKHQHSEKRRPRTVRLDHERSM